MVDMQMMLRAVAIASLMMLSLTSRVEAQLTGTLDLQTNCEKALTGLRLTGNMFQLPVTGGTAYQCFGFIAAIQQLSTVVMQGEGHSLTYLCLPKDSTLVQKHPEKLNEHNAAYFVITALAEAFPCN
jgi:hypothetical protein